MVERKIAAVAICFPAVSNLTQCRIRICLSAKHTRQMLDEVSQKTSETFIQQAKTHKGNATT